MRGSLKDRSKLDLHYGSNPSQNLDLLPAVVAAQQPLASGENRRWRLVAVQTHHCNGPMQPAQRERSANWRLSRRVSSKRAVTSRRIAAIPVI